MRILSNTGIVTRVFPGNILDKYLIESKSNLYLPTGIMENKFRGQSSMSDHFALAIMSPMIVERRGIGMSFTSKDHFVTLLKRNDIVS